MPVGFIMILWDDCLNIHPHWGDRGAPARTTFNEWTIKYGQQIGVHLTPHRLRHTLTTRLINQGMPIHSLRRLLGHQRLDTTQIYAHIYDETLYQQFKEAMSRLEAIEVEDWPGVETSEPVQTEIWVAK